jgi:hypothetical protein
MKLFQGNYLLKCSALIFRGFVIAGKYSKVSFSLARKETAMNRSISTIFVATCSMIFAVALCSSPAWAQHGHGGHGGRGHGGHGGHGSVHISGLGVHFGGHGGHTSVHGGRSGYGSVHIGGHSGHHSNYYDGHSGHHGYSTHHTYHVSPWYTGVALGQHHTPYYSSYSPLVVRKVYAAAKRPVTASQVEISSSSATATAEGLRFLHSAEVAFRSGRYSEAARYAHHALVEMPRDGKLYLFTSQTLFATGDYKGAAATIHHGVSLLEPKDWGYVVENYQRYYRGRDFVTQMDRLNESLKKNPEAAHVHFVRGYQHGYLGHTKMAIKELLMAIELESRDQLAVRLLERFGGTLPEPAKSVEPSTEG